MILNGRKNEMDFTIFYRSDNGALINKTISASNRSDAIRILRKQGLSAIRIEVAKSSTATTSNAIKDLRYMPICLISAIAIFIAIYYFLVIDKSAQPQPKKVVTVPSKSQQIILPEKNINDNIVVKESRKLSPDEKRAARSAEMRANRKPLVRKDIVMRPDGSFLYTDSKGRRICCLEKHEVVDERNRFKSPFKHKVEAYLSNFAIPGQNIPPMPPMKFSLDDLQAALSAPITIDMATDSDEMIIKKQNVEQLKGFLKDALNQGISFDEFISRLEEQQRKEATLVQESKKMIIETLATGKKNEAKELLDALNKNLNDSGIPNLRLPAKYRKMIDEVDQQ